MALSPSIIKEINPFETEDYLQCWHQYLAPKFNTQVITKDFLIYSKPLLKGFLLLKELRFPGWNNAWFQDFTTARANEFLEFQQNIPWDYFRMQWSESRKDLQAFHLLEKAGLRIFQVPSPPEYIMDLSNGWEGYMQTKGRNSRKDIKEKIKKAHSFGAELSLYEGAGAIEEFFDIFFKHHIEYWNKKVGFSYFNDPHEQDFIINWAKTLECSKNLILQGFSLNGELVNLSMSIRFGEIIYAVLLINTGIHLNYYPGIVGLYLRAKEASLKGIKTINIGVGDHGYKSQASSYQVKTFETIIANPSSLKGKIYTKWLCKKLSM